MTTIDRDTEAGERLQRYLEKLGISNADFAVLLGVSSEDIQEWVTDGLPVTIAKRVSALLRKALNDKGIEVEDAQSPSRGKIAEMIPIGEAIQRVREYRQYSQADVADHLGMTYRGYANYEQGATNVSAPVLIKIAKFLNVKTSVLLGETPFEYAIDDEFIESYQNSSKSTQDQIRAIAKIIQDAECVRNTDV